MLSVMALFYASKKTSICGLAFSMMLVAGSTKHSSYDQKLDQAWKKYHNPEYGYCVSIPARWARGEAFEGAGLYVEAGAKKYSRPLGAIDFEAVAQSPLDAKILPVTLADNLQDHLAGLQKFERAERMEMIDKHTIQLEGSNGLFAKHRYYDPQERATWMEEVLFVERETTVYRFELDCKADQIERFAPVFEHLLESVRFDCSN